MLRQKVPTFPQDGRCEPRMPSCDLQVMVSHLALCKGLRRSLQQAHVKGETFLVCGWDTACVAALLRLPPKSTPADLCRREQRGAVVGNLACRQSLQLRHKEWPSKPTAHRSSPTRPASDTGEEVVDVPQAAAQSKLQELPSTHSKAPEVTEQQKGRAPEHRSNPD